MHLSLLFSSRLVQFIDTPGNLPPSMNLTRQLNLRRDSNLSATYRWVLREPPLPPTHLRANWGHAVHVPLPSRECKSGAGLWEVLQLDKSYDLDEHLKTPKVRAGAGRSSC